MRLRQKTPKSLICDGAEFVFVSKSLKMDSIALGRAYRASGLRLKYRRFAMAGKRLVSLALAPLLALFAERGLCQDSLYVPSEPTAVFTAGAAFLTTTRDTSLAPAGPFIAGPDSGRLSFADAEFGYQSGVRAFLAMSSNGIRIEGIFSDYGAWNSVGSGTLTQGVAFDEGRITNWAGGNFINLTTGFESLHAATDSAMGGTPDEEEGLGRSVAFPGDDLPTYEVLYRSILQSFELNMVTEDPAARVQIGLGYRNLQLDEVASVGITGTLRAVDATAPFSGGISHNALTTFGGLTHLAGTADGFEDETGNLSALPDTLQMFHDARTSNDLNGAQLIFSEQIMYWRGWTIDGIGKAGAYHNHVNATVSERYIGTDPGSGNSSTYGRTYADSKSQLAFAGSVGLQSNFPLSRNWSVIGGYEMMYMYGVALSPEQYAGVTGTTFVGRTFNADTHGELISHGGNLGLQYSY